MPQHTAVVEAAKAAGVALLAYTSILGGDEATFRLAEEHQATEAVIRASGLPYVLLRNGWYTENYTANAAVAVEHGAVVGSNGDARIATASRQDYADAAVAVLTGEGHENAVYELSGDEGLELLRVRRRAGRAHRQAGLLRGRPAEKHPRDPGRRRPAGGLRRDPGGRGRGHRPGRAGPRPRGAVEADRPPHHPAAPRRWPPRSELSETRVMTKTPIQG
ncbi:hypothetical protein GCM10020229_31120 [Kitasatospora albolonga]